MKRILIFVVLILSISMFATTWEIWDKMSEDAFQPLDFYDKSGEIYSGNIIDEDSELYFDILSPQYNRLNPAALPEEVYESEWKAVKIINENFDGVDYIILRATLVTAVDKTEVYYLSSLFTDFNYFDLSGMVLKTPNNKAVQPLDVIPVYTGVFISGNFEVDLDGLSALDMIDFYLVLTYPEGTISNFYNEGELSFSLYYQGEKFAGKHYFSEDKEKYVELITEK